MAKIIIEMPDLHDTKEAALLLGISYATLFRWIRKDVITPVRVGDRTLIPQSEIRRIKDKNINKMTANTT